MKTYLLTRKKAFFIFYQNDFRKFHVFLTFPYALFKWIANEVFWTAADWIVIDHATFCSKAACSFAWISAFLIDTGFVLETFAAGNTFWSTIWWITHKT